MRHICTYSHQKGNPAAPLHQPTPYELSCTGSERSAGGVRFRPILPRGKLLREGNRGLFITNPNKALLLGKSHNITLHLHCLIPAILSNLMTPEETNLDYI